MTDKERIIQLEKLLQESEERFRSFYEKVPLGYQSLDEDGCFLLVNETWLDTLGYEKNDIVGKWFGDFLAPDQVEAFRERFPLFKSRGKVHTQFEMVHKSGEHRFIEFDGRIGRTSNGSFERTHCILQDRTEQRRTELALKESESRFRSLLEAAPVGIVLSDNNHKTLFVNRKFTDIFGYTSEDMPSVVEWLTLAFPDEEYRLTMKIQGEATVSKSTMENVASVPVECKVTCKNGELRYVLIDFVAIRDTNIITFVDLTDRRNAEEELRAIKEDMEIMVQQKTVELQERISELERFAEATVDREYRMKELRDELKKLKGIRD